MRIAESVTVPPALERARIKGELVIFAGAGVSMGPPANLPSFPALAREIGELTLPLTAADEKALDGYLGRIEGRGVRVQERAREKLRERGGQHTPLHEHMVGLFGDAEHVRLITTNFDPHFEAAASVVFPNARIPRYVGPALPPGAPFRGIAQIHGSLAEPQDRLVLTDSDFAAAYMADGWAARFLVGVFHARTILFIGYSLTDPVMQYLLSALPANDRWYALCHEDECPQWTERKVVPVSFRTRGDGERYGDLTDALRRWRWYAQASPTDHDHELKRLVRSGPPSSSEEADYVSARLEGDAGRTVFWHAATDARWFWWAASNGFLDDLFDESGANRLAAPWAQWCLANFCSGARPVLLQFIRRRSLRVHPYVAFEIVLYLARANPLPEHPVVRQLVALLVNQAPRSSSGVDHYDWLLQRLTESGFHEEALALLEWMTRLRLEPIEHLYAAIEDEDEGGGGLRLLTNRLGMAASASDVADFLERHALRLATSAGDQLVALGMKRLTEAYDLLALARANDDSPFDGLSFGRTSIGPSNQDRSANLEDVLVLMVRSSLDYWRAAEPTKLCGFGERLSRSAHTLVRRLALYAFAECKSLAPDELLDRASAEHWAADFMIRPEFYRALKAHFVAASEEAKARFIESLRDEASWGAFDDHHAHARFSISQLLARLASTSDVTIGFAKAERRAHPDWLEQDPDGFLTRTEVRWGSELPSPVEATAMLAWTATEALERLVALLAEPANDDARDSLLGAVQQAVKTTASWGIDLLKEVSRSLEPSSKLAGAVLWGLRETAPSVESQLDLLDCCRGWEWPDDITRALASLLEKLSQDLAVSGDHPLLDALDDIADRVYLRSKNLDSALVSEAGWTERAINHPAGHAASVWWATANVRNRVDGKLVYAIGMVERARWNRVLDDESAAGAYARVILGMASDRLAIGDEPWAQTRLFAAFDPAAGAERAAQLWDGRLSHTHFYWGTLVGLKPFLPAFLASSATLVPARSSQLGDLIALLVAHPEDSGFTLELLHQFIRGAKADARHAFAAGLPERLSSVGPEARQQLWHDVLRPYWRDRRTNVPVSLDADEVSGMIQWIVELPEVADEALLELEQTPADRLQHVDRVIWDWREDNSWVRAHPTEACGIIKWLADRHSMESWTASDAVPQLEVALGAGAARAAVVAAAEAVAALPCTAAVDLVERLRRERPA